MDAFVMKFKQAIYYGVLGMYRRLTEEEAEQEERFTPALTKACSICAYLNIKYKLYDEDNNKILPETEYELFMMFESPLSVVINKLPEKLKSKVIEETSLIGLDAIFERIDKYNGVFTEEGYDFFKQRDIFAAKNEKNQMAEFDGQLIYAELCKGDYTIKRLFLESPDNVYIPDSIILRTEEQKQFIKSYPDLFNLSYKDSKKSNLYRCKYCGMILREYRPGIFSCVSDRCKKETMNFQDIEVININGTGKVMSEIAAHNIYYPGQLEMQIKNILDKYILKKKIKKFELWPDQDTWDFKVEFNNGTVWLMDAKNVENQHWIIDDMIGKMSGKYEGRIIYVVPDFRDKVYLKMINENHRYSGTIECIRLKELEEMLEWEVK